MAYSELNNNLKFPDGAKFYPDIKDGIRGYNTDPARGADTFVPFKKSASSSGSVLLYGKDNVRSFTVAFTGCTKLSYDGGGAIVTLDGINAASSANNKEITDGQHSLVFTVNVGVSASISYSFIN